MTGATRTFAVIPAAGKSTRMGQPKLALTLGGRSILERVIDAFRLASIDTVIVVLAPHVQFLADAVREAGAQVLVLTEATSDMRATVEHGLHWLEQHCSPAADDYWFLAPADHPLLELTVIGELLRAQLEHQEASIIIPAYEGTRGHPALIRWRHIKGIRALPPNQGLNTYFRQQAKEVLELPVSKPEVLCDLDTPEAYEELQKRWHRMHH